MITADEFLKVAKLYQLGFLDTEKPHPRTMQLSEWARGDLTKAISVLIGIDIDALDVVKKKAADIARLRSAILNARSAGGRIFLCGCGATGRLSLLLETLFRQTHAGDESVVAFMAGGDVALVHSVEGFEDFPEYGAKHLRELGFGDGDLLISTTEGGETPYVIGATLEAARLSRVKPYILYCNRTEILRDNIERSREFIESPKIEKIELFVGPMALAGSTRMQASTVLQLAVGLALLSENEAELWAPAGDGSVDLVSDAIDSLKDGLRGVDIEALARICEKESSVYQNGEFVYYVPEDFHISVFTDTTERAPTFSLTPFSHDKAERLLTKAPSYCYVGIPQATNAAQAWEILLNRKPRPLGWMDVDPRTGADYLNAFDFSPLGREFRRRLTKNGKHHDFRISVKDGRLCWELVDCLFEVKIKNLMSKGVSLLLQHTLLKMLINIHSTLIMGRLGRYESNLMTWVYPNNGKLIDRATRYARILLAQKGKDIPYETVVRRLLEIHRDIPSNTSVVLQTTASF